MLPDIELTVEALSTEEFNKLRGVTAHARVDLDLYAQGGGGKKAGAAAKRRKRADGSVAGDGDDEDEDDEAAEDALGGGKKGRGAGASTGFYRIRCRDNGGGMPHDKVWPRASKFLGMGGLPC